jgi:ribose 5-phosphate isomerase A
MHSEFIMHEIPIADKAKDAAAKHAAGLIKNNSIVGIGTGSTAVLFIKHLICRCQEGLKIQALATSLRSQLLAAKGGIPLIDPNTLVSIDIAVDGADEMDPKKQMIKGAGGALLREKIIASMAQEMIVIIDESKCVKHLGARPLPVEILPFAYKATLAKIQKMGFDPVIRKLDGALYLTDNGNYIADLHTKNFLIHPMEVQQNLLLIPGIIETGLFINMAGRVIIGHPEGTITIQE